MNEVAYASQAARIFLDAASYIRTFGWQVKSMGRHGAPRCSMGALASANPEEKWEDGLSRLMYQTLYDELDGISLTHFNYKFRDGEKAAELFERVAVRLQSK